ncbi:MAG TPA: hypothetical protein VGM62_06665 [Chthoniobacterales bacterium]
MFEFCARFQQMRPLICLIVVVGCSVILVDRATAASKPADGGAPIFRIFASGSVKGGTSSPINISNKFPLMVVSTGAKVQLSQDRKAVRVVLTPSDARKFADITRRHVHEILILEANGRVLEAMQVTSPVTNGTLEFSYPDDAAVVDYLRKRFHLK